MKLVSAYSPKKRVYEPIIDDPEHRVKTEFKKEVNINTIIERMKKGIQPPPWMTSKTPHYGDFADMPASLMESFEIVQRAHEAFESLPVEFRREIDHNPANLASAPRELYERFGLLKKLPKAEGATAPEPKGATQRVQGDRDLPATGLPGPKKGASKPQSNAEPEEA